MARAIANDHHEKKANILQQASSLFVAESFSRVSMAQLAEACDISKSNLYHYYRDKETILFTLLDEHMDEILHALQQTVTKHNTHTQLDYLILALLELYQHADYKHRLLLNDLQVLPEKEQNTIRQKERLIVQFFKHAILLEYPDYTKQPQLLSASAMAILGSINWSFTWFNPQRGLSVAEYATFTANLYRQGLKDAAKITNDTDSENNSDDHTY